MITIVTEIAKYLIIFFMVLYTVKCFTVLKPVPADKKRRALNVQIFYVFMIHFLCYLTLYLHYEKREHTYILSATDDSIHNIYGFISCHL